MDEAQRPVLAVTLGDVAGIGPELLVRAWGSALLHGNVRPWVFGDPTRLRLEAQRQSRPLRIVTVVDRQALMDDPAIMPVFPASGESLDHVPLGRADARAGKAAYDFLITAIDQTLAGAADGIVTLPLHKEGLRLAGLDYPGHTEILAERTGVGDYAMMLYRRDTKGGPRPGLGVVHVTLHRALREVFAGITVATVAAKARLLDEMLRRLGHVAPRIAVAALNPHAGDGGLFGDEEIAILRPAVERARAAGVEVTGPLPADTLFVRAVGGEFDGVVAQYHDQGHIALKLLGWKQAVNITVGLPIVRTSVAHGTAYDIVGKDLADPASLEEAVTIARQLVLANNREKACIPPQLILVRHAATAANQQRPYVLQGCRLDNPLSALGLRQAEAVAAALADMPIAAVYSSPLSRAMQTAERIAAPHGHQPQAVAEVIEADIGVWDGLSWEQIAQRWPEEHRAFHDDPSQWGYLQGENFEQVRLRCVAALEQLVDRHEGRTIVVVGHNVVNRVALAHWMGIPVRWARKVPQDNGGYSVVGFVDGVAAPRTINSAQHLSALTSAE